MLCIVPGSAVEGRLVIETSPKNMYNSEVKYEMNKVIFSK
jgi:hypothetical protein